MPRPLSPNAGSGTTRRRLIASGAAAAVIGSSVATSRATAGAHKLSPADISYQPTPKAGQRCDLCVNWRPPDGCKVVDGAISPSGWCPLFARGSNPAG
jgi:hypothetical protein